MQRAIGRAAAQRTRTRGAKLCTARTLVLMLPNLEVLFGIPPHHRLWLIRSQGRGGPMWGEYWTHEEVNQGGTVMARYESYDEVDARGHVRCGWRTYPGFTWSSQHLERGGCDGRSEAAFGSVWARRVAVAW